MEIVRNMEGGLTLRIKRKDAVSDDKASPTGLRAGDDGETEVMVVKKEYCSFCGDLIESMDLAHICQDCGAYMCEQSMLNCRGCLFNGTVKRTHTFRCVLCDARLWRSLQDPPRGDLPYGFTGYGGRKKAKLTWPLLIVTMGLATTFEALLAEALRLDFYYHYIASPANLKVIDLEIKPNAQPKTGKQMAEGYRFIRQSIRSKLPANIFIVLDTHSDTLTGKLQWSGGSTSPRVTSADDIITQFCGETFAREMKAAANFARHCEQPTGRDWYSDSPYLRGGWRALLLATCGPAMRIREGFMALKSLVANDCVDFVFGFGGSSTISIQVKNVVCNVIEAIGVDKTAGIWDTIARVVGRDLNLLYMNSAVVIFRERGGDVKARHIGLHSPPLRAWGVELNACATEGCRPSAYEFTMWDRNGRVRMQCRKCMWKTAALAEKDVEHVIFRLSSVVPDVFWHEYPPSFDLRTIFVRITEERGAIKKKDGEKEVRARKKVKHSRG